MNIASNRRDFVKVTAAAAATVGWMGKTVAANASAEPAQAASGAGQVRSAESAGSSQEVPLAPPDKQPAKLPVPEPVARKIGWAIVGLGELALEEVMPAFRECRLSRPVALVSGHPEKARKVADAYGIQPTAIYGYENYGELARNKEVEVIYIILPNSMHAEYTVRGLRAGKHVLCEKPMATSVQECEQMIAAAKEADRKLMVAYRLHYEPMNLTVAELLRKKVYGEAKTVCSSNCQNTPAPNIRLSKKLGGGPIGDVGIYSINTTRMILGEEPVEVSAMVHQPKDNPRFREVPESATFTLRFPSGVLVHCDCSFNSTESRRYRVHCEKGFVEMDPAFSYRGLRLRVKDGESKAGTPQLAEWNVKEVNHFTAEMDHFSECILNGKAPRTPGEEGLRDIRIIEAIEESARTGKSVRL